MEKLLVLTTSAFILTCAAITASAQQSPSTPMTHQPDQQQTQQQSTDQDGCGMMGQGGMMGRGMMGQGGMMGRCNFNEEQHHNSPGLTFPAA
jgi:hypothetical protein